MRHTHKLRVWPSWLSSTVHTEPHPLSCSLMTTCCHWTPEADGLRWGGSGAAVHSPVLVADGNHFPIWLPAEVGVWRQLVLLGSRAHLHDIFKITHIYIQQQTWSRLSQPGAPAVISALLHQVYTREFVVQLEACGQVLLWLAGDPGRQKKLMHGCKIVLLPLVSAA